MRNPLKRLLFAAIAVTLAATGAVATATPAQAAPIGDHVLFWNDVLLKSYRAVGGAPGPLARAGAMTHLAMFESVNTINCYKTGSYDVFNCLAIDYTGSNTISTWNNPDVETAIDYAAYTVLSSVYPSISFAADLAAAQSGIPVDASQQQGQSIGIKAGQNMISYRTNDNSGDATAHTEHRSRVLAAHRVR